MQIILTKITCLININASKHIYFTFQKYVLNICDLLISDYQHLVSFEYDGPHLCYNARKNVEKENRNLMIL